MESKLFSVLILLLLSFSPLGLVEAPNGSDLISALPDFPPKIDGVLSKNEWGSASRFRIQHGFLLVQNDASNLYILIDLTGDTSNDPPLAMAPWGDNFWLTFDADLDSSITPNVDLQYATYPGTHNLGLQKYLGPGVWTGLFETRSELGAGFGSSSNPMVPHRFWELAIRLTEIDAVPNRLVRMGLKAYSQNPSFDDYNPESFTTDFTNLIEASLVTPEVDLLVLAHEDFLDELKPLKKHKDYTGIKTYVQSWQSLNKSFDGWDGPERVKRGIANYEECCDTLYVMLVGDCDRFPVRYTMTDRGVPEAYNRAFYSADLYYADLYKSDGSFDDWDSNDNNYYGELHSETIAGVLNVDQVDAHPDIMVGRVPASSIS